MALNQVTTGNTILAFDVNQLVQILQRLTGQTETSKYFTTGWTSGSGQFISQYMRTLSQTSVPASVSVDTTDGLPGALNTPGVGHLTSTGFQLYSQSNASGNNLGFGGNWTVSY